MSLSINGPGFPKAHNQPAETSRTVKPVIVFKSDLEGSRGLFGHCLYAYDRFDRAREHALAFLYEKMIDDPNEVIAAPFDVSGGDEIQGSYYHLRTDTPIRQHCPDISTACGSSGCTREKCSNPGRSGDECVHKKNLCLKFHDGIAVGYEFFHHEQTNRCNGYVYVVASDAVRYQKALRKANLSPAASTHIQICGDDRGELGLILNYCISLSEDERLDESLKEGLFIAITGFLNALLDYKAARKPAADQKNYYECGQNLKDTLNQLIAILKDQKVAGSRGDDSGNHIFVVAVAEKLAASQIIYDAESYPDF